jgi:hypothetical protein
MKKDRRRARKMDEEERWDGMEDEEIKKQLRESTLLAHVDSASHSVNSLREFKSNINACSACVNRTVAPLQLLRESTSYRRGFCFA